MRKPLTPPDLARCQAEQREGSFMTLGPRGMARCASVPVVVATEQKPGKDRRRGKMSLCSSCQEALVRLMGPDYATFKEIKR